jgi:hypothetical protein
LRKRTHAGRIYIRSWFLDTPDKPGYDKAV